MLKITLRTLLTFAVITFALHSTANATYFRRAESLDARPALSPNVHVNDLSIVSRILKSYQLVASPQESRGNSMWQFIFDQHHTDIHKIFLHGDISEAAVILRNPGASDLFYGIDNLSKSVINNVLSTPADHAKICLDGLIRFAEAAGILSLDNPEAHSYLPPRIWTADQIIQHIETAMGLTLLFPNPFPNEPGVWTHRGVVSYRVPQALYQAWRIKQLLKDKPHPRVLEIGAGVGRTAYYARLFGIEDYTIIDLPLTGAVSAYFLARTLGENQVCLFGESPANPQHLIKILPPNEFLSNFEKYDLIINVDSMTEIDPGIARAYFNKIQTSTGIFLSINHEINPFTVKNLIESSESNLDVMRFPYWMRNGYVEEIIQFHD